MRKLVAPIVMLTAVGVAVAAYTVSTTTAVRADCPGKIVCPQTGELVCRDQCPTVDGDRPDCPGRIECPLTGELVCVDRCPLGRDGAAAKTDTPLPACCRGGD